MSGLNNIELIISLNTNQLPKLNKSEYLVKLNIFNRETLLEPAKVLQSINNKSNNSCTITYACQVKTSIGTVLAVEDLLNYPQLIDSTLYTNIELLDKIMSIDLVFSINDMSGINLKIYKTEELVKT